MSRKARWRSALALALVTGGCGDLTPSISVTPTELPSEAAPAPTPVPTATPGSTTASALFGTVANGLGCPIFYADMAPPWPSPFQHGYSLALPDGYGWRERPGEITAPDGTVLARVGDRIELEGTIDPTSFCVAPTFMATSIKLAPP